MSEIFLSNILHKYTVKVANVHCIDGQFVNWKHLQGNITIVPYTFKWYTLQWFYHYITINKIHNVCVVTTLNFKRHQIFEVNIPT